MHERGISILLQSIFLAIVSGVWVSIVLGLLVLAITGLAEAGSNDDITAGTLQLRTVNGELLRQAPLVNTDVQMTVTGVLSRVRVIQSFTNPNPQWVEGVYLFPLPADAAVDRLRMRIGDRVIEGEIQEKQQARRTYQRAKQDGKQASLLSQSRPNVFTASVANIPPQGRIEIEIAYQQSLSLSQGRFSLRFPLVVAPRYRPMDAGVSEPDTACREQVQSGECVEIADQDFSTDTVVAAPLHNPVSIRIDLHTGLALQTIDSAYHPVDIVPLGAGRYRVALRDGIVPAERDFELSWRPETGDMPGTALFREDREDGHYQLLMLMPPRPDFRPRASSRELVLVVDKSGSMHGASLAQAKAAVKLALRRLKPADRFNLIQFDNQAGRLFPEARPADKANIRLALDYLRRMQADGGTEMLAAMQLALDDPAQQSALRQVVFLTDGAVANEQRLYRTIVEKLGDSRLFTVGIGSAPNSYFMTRAAEFGRGGFTYIGKVDEVREKMAALFTKLETAALTDIEVDWHGAQVEQWPRRIPDLYSGEPLVLAVRSDQPLSALSVRGNLGQRAWQQRVQLDDAGENTGINVLWARRKLRSLMGEMNRGGDQERLRREIIDLALTHHLVSRFTSLVAVDKTPIRPLDEPLDSKTVPRNLPAGWNAQKVFGQLPQTATPARLQLLLGLIALLAAALLGRPGSAMADLIRRRLGS